jgi:hypothetical protein
MRYELNLQVGTAGYYRWNWKTPKAYAKSCKILRLALGDGGVHEALFQFSCRSILG